jgi:hypothetical protein
MGRYFSKMPRISKSRKQKPLQGSVGQQRKNSSRDDKRMGHSAQIVSSSAGFDDASATGEAQTERYVAVSFEAMVDDSPLPENVSKEPGSAASS